MGLDAPAIQFLCAAKHRGVDFSEMAMIGRQWLLCDPEPLRRVFAVLGVDVDPAAFVAANKFAEPFFKLLGAGEIDSVDASTYEGATLIHDLNRPIPDALRERFSLVYDGGTLEHIFHYPQALKNCMEMVRVGGHFAQLTVANNYMGHGFWQVSPELSYRALSPENGYRVEAVLLTEVDPKGDGPWYVARDPREIRRRVELVNHRPTFIVTLAKRLARADIFASPPQQSDYAVAWKQGDGDDPGAAPQAPAPRAGGLRRLVPRPVKDALKGVGRAVRGPAAAPEFDPACYDRVEEADLLRGRLP